MEILVASSLDLFCVHLVWVILVGLVIYCIGGIRVNMWVPVFLFDEFANVEWEN